MIAISCPRSLLSKTVGAPPSVNRGQERAGAPKGVIEKDSPAWGRERERVGRAENSAAQMRDDKNRLGTYHKKNKPLERKHTSIVANSSYRKRQQ